MNIFLEELSHLLQFYCPNTTDEVVVLGDFNVHFGEDTNSVNLANLLHQYGLSQMVTDATRISGYTLDLIFSNPYSLPVSTEVSKELIETTNPQIKFDHFPISFSVMDEFEPISHDASIKYQKSFRKINQIDIDSFVSSLDSKLSADFDSTCNIFQQQLVVYNTSLVSTLDMYAPSQTKTVIPSSKAGDPPWMDSVYKNERAIRRRLEKQWKRLGTEASKESMLNNVITVLLLQTQT